jgi:tetratricopeptide (TPR) repeat protein
MMKNLFSHTNARPGRNAAFCILFVLLACPFGITQGPLSGEIRSHYERAQSDLKTNRPDDAMQEFNAILKLDPNNAEALANLGLIAFARAKYQEAVTDFHSALKIRPAMLNAQVFLGLAEMRLGASSEAQQLLEGAFTRLKDTGLRLQVGTALVQLDDGLGKLDEALVVANALEQMSPLDPEILYLVYRTHSALAARALTTMSKVGPDSARLHEVLAESHATDGDFTDAISEYQKALAINPNLAGLHFELGQAILRNNPSGDSLQSAEQQFTLGLAENPYDSHSEYELGEINFMQSHWEAALKHYSRAAQLDPGSADTQLSIGKVFITTGQLEEGAKHLLEAVRIDPENPTAHYRLALAYRSLKRSDDAQREMKTFQALQKSTGTTSRDSSK